MLVQSLASTNEERAGARDLFEESVALSRAAGDRWEMIRPLHNLACCLREMGEIDRAYALFEECLAEARVLRTHVTQLRTLQGGDRS